jgi:hypothetical protein
MRRIGRQPGVAHGLVRFAIERLADAGLAFLAPLRAAISRSSARPRASRPCDSAPIASVASLSASRDFGLGERQRVGRFLAALFNFGKLMHQLTAAGGDLIGRFGDLRLLGGFGGAGGSDGEMAFGVRCALGQLARSEAIASSRRKRGLVFPLQPFMGGTCLGKTAAISGHLGIDLGKAASRSGQIGTGLERLLCLRFSASTVFRQVAHRPGRGIR